MEKLALTIGVVEAMPLVFAELPIWARETGRIIYDAEGNPVPNVSAYNGCSHFDTECGVCRVKCNTWSEKNVLVDGVFVKKHQFVATEKVMFSRTVKDNPEWSDYAQDGQETVDIHIVSALEDEDALLKDIYVKGLAGNMSQYREPGNAWDVIRGWNSYPCLHKVGDTWHHCHFYSGIRFANWRIKQGGDDKDIARDILWVFVRPDRRTKPLGHEWSWDDYQRATVQVTENIVRMTTRKKNPLPVEKATKIAWGTFLSRHPEMEEYRQSVKNVGLNDGQRLAARWDAYAYLKQNGIETSTKEASNAYNQKVSKYTVNGEQKRFFSPMSDCPITTDAPEGKYAALIVRHTAVTDKLKEIWAEDVEKHDAVVKLADGSYMSASAFNWLSKSERKKLLGCTCKHCVQEDIYSPRHDKNGLVYFTVNSESLLRLGRFEVIASYLARLQEQGQVGITGEEEDMLRESGYILSYDIEGLPDHDPMSDSIEELEDYEEFLCAQDSLNYQETADKLDKYLEDFQKNGPVVYYTTKLDAFGGVELEKRVKDYVKESNQFAKDYKKHQCELKKMLGRPKTTAPVVESPVYPEPVAKVASKTKFYTASNMPLIPEGWSMDDFRRFMPHDYQVMMGMKAETCVGKIAQDYVPQSKRIW